MKAMILAAGLGTRLAPLTSTTAKPALPFMGKPIICHTIEFLQNSGIDEFVVNLHHLPETIKEVINKLEVKVTYSYEEILLGTAGGLKKAEKFFNNETLIMINADCYYEGSLLAALSAHINSGALATMILKNYDNSTYNPVVVNEKSGKVLSIAGKPDNKEGIKKIFTGIHIIEPEIFSLIPPDRAYDINSGVYIKCLKEKSHNIGYFPYSGYWSDLGTTERIKKATEFLEKREKD